MRAVQRFWDSSKRDYFAEQFEKAKTLKAKAEKERIQ
jgi:hypothetical protein